MFHQFHFLEQLTGDELVLDAQPVGLVAVRGAEGEDQGAYSDALPHGGAGGPHEDGRLVLDVLYRHLHLSVPPVTTVLRGKRGVMQ